MHVRAGDGEDVAVLLANENGRALARRRRAVCTPVAWYGMCRGGAGFSYLFVYKLLYYYLL